MIRGIRFILYSIFCLSLIFPSGFVMAQSNPKQPSPFMYSEIPEGAVVIGTQYLDTCGGKFYPEKPCYLVSFMKGPAQNNEAILSGAINSVNWYTCGYSIKNFLGNTVATFANVTQAEYSSSYPYAYHWNLYSGYNSVWAAFGYSWDDLYGPDPYPGWNQWSQLSNTYSQGTLHYLASPNDYYAQLNFYSSGSWNCRAGAGTISPH